MRDWEKLKSIICNKNNEDHCLLTVTEHNQQVLNNRGQIVSLTINNEDIYFRIQTSRAWRKESDNEIEKRIFKPAIEEQDFEKILKSLRNICPDLAAQLESITFHTI